MEAPKGWIFIEGDYSSHIVLSIAISMSFTIYLVSMVIISHTLPEGRRWSFLLGVYLAGMLTMVLIGALYYRYRLVEYKARTVCALGLGDAKLVVERHLKDRDFNIRESSKGEMGICGPRRTFEVIDSRIKIEIEAVSPDHVSVLIGPYSMKEEPTFDVLLAELHVALKDRIALIDSL